MTRTPAAATLLFLLLSFLAVAHCRPHEAQPATDAVAVAAAGDDENGPPNPTLPTEEPEVLPAAEQQHGFLRLPSHRLRGHHPCRHGLFHRHLWWAPRHDHGAFGEDAPRRFHHHHVEALRHLPADETREADEVKAVAEPDPDSSSRTSRDGDAGDAAHEAGEDAAARACRKEMLRRWVHFQHHGMRLHHRHHDKEEGHEQEEDEAAEAMKLFHFHHHRHDEEEEEEKKDVMRKRLRQAEHDDSDSDDEDEEVEEMVRRFRKAIMRRSFGGHGRRRFHHQHHHYGHRHGEEAEEGGVVSWIKGLANWF